MITVLTVIATWKLFVKSGEKGWKCLIPFYCDYVMYKKFYDKKLFWNLVISWGATVLLAIIAFVRYATRFAYYNWNYIYGYSYYRVGFFGVLAIILAVASVVCTLVFSALLMWYTGKAFGAKPIHCLAMIFVPIPSLILLGLDEGFKYEGNKRPECIPKKAKEQKAESEQ